MFGFGLLGGPSPAAPAPASGAGQLVTGGHAPSNTTPLRVGNRPASSSSSANHGAAGVASLNHGAGPTTSFPMNAYVVRSPAPPHVVPAVPARLGAAVQKSPYNNNAAAVGAGVLVVPSSVHGGSGHQQPPHAGGPRTGVLPGVLPGTGAPHASTSAYVPTSNMTFVFPFVGLSVAGTSVGLSVAGAVGSGTGAVGRTKARGVSVGGGGNKCGAGTFVFPFVGNKCGAGREQVWGR